MIKNVYILIASLIIHSFVFSQIGIGTSNPKDSALLDGDSISKKVSIPITSLTSTVNTSTIINPVNNLLIYNTNHSTSNTNGKSSDNENGFIMLVEIVELTANDGIHIKSKKDTGKSNSVYLTSASYSKHYCNENKMEMTQRFISSIPYSFASFPQKGINTTNLEKSAELKKESNDKGILHPKAALSSSIGITLPPYKHQALSLKALQWSQEVPQVL